MNNTLPDQELKDLDRLAHVTIGYLIVVSLVSFFTGAYLLPHLVGIGIIGISGSAIAALTSTLDRYAMGFERETGEWFPERAKEGVGKFNRRFARWLFVRPLLGAVVAPVFVWGLSHFASDPERYLEGVETLGFTSFMGGLLAKSVLDLIKNLFKNVFRG
jgi:hypothetical protein